MNLFTHTARACALRMAAWSLLAINSAWAAPGDLDPWFGMAPGEISVSPGYVELDYVGMRYRDPGDNGNRAMVTDAQGRILIAESWHTDYVSTRTQTFVRRLNADGTVDTTWGTSGLVTLPDVGSADEAFIFHPATIAITTHNLTLENLSGDFLSDPVGYLAAWNARNHVLVAVGMGQNIHVFAYRNNGQLDAQFGPTRNGRASLALRSPLGTSLSMAVHRGHITLASWIEEYQADLNAPQFTDRMLIARMTSSGMPPSSGTALATYAVDGRSGAVNRLTDLAVDPVTQALYACGYFVTAEQADEPNADSDIATKSLVLMRLDARGAPELGFGTKGFATLTNAGEAYLISQIAFQSNGRILLGGLKLIGVNDVRSMIPSIWAFRDNGELDPTFGTDGVAEAPSPFGYDSFSYGSVMKKGLLVDSQDRIYAGGNLTASIPTKIPGEPIYAREGFLARLTAEGRLDASFGNYYNYYNPGSPRLSVINSSRDCDRLAWSRGAPLCMGDEARYPTDRGRLRVYKFQP